MGLLDFLSRRDKPVRVSRRLQPVEPIVRRINTRPPEEQLTPELLRNKLFAAAASAAQGDDEKLTCLCQKHEKSIFQDGLIWTQVPPAIRANPRLLRWYGNGLVALASACAQRLGKPELIKKIPKLDLRPVPSRATETIPSPANRAR
jgi:hypothetical protein